MTNKYNGIDKNYYFEDYSDFTLYRKVIEFEAIALSIVIHIPLYSVIASFSDTNEILEDLADFGEANGIKIIIENWSDENE